MALNVGVTNAWCKGKLAGISFQPCTMYTFRGSNFLATTSQDCLPNLLIVLFLEYLEVVGRRDESRLSSSCDTTNVFKRMHSEGG